MVDVLRPIIDVYTDPPLKFHREFPQPVDLVGTGNLPDLNNSLLRPQYGAVFIARDIPPNLSRTAGLRPSWKRPLLELTLVALTGGPSPPLPVAFLEMHRDYEVFRFYGPELTNIEYSVLPGVRVEWSYLSFI